MNKEYKRYTTTFSTQNLFAHRAVRKYSKEKRRWGKDGNRKQILYQQPAAGHRTFFKGSTTALVGRGHALALGCNI